MRLALSVAALLLSIAPSFADTATDTVRAELHAFNDRFNAYAEAYDVDGIVSLYDEKALWIAPKTPPVAGLETPRNTFSFLTENKGSITHSVDELIISDDGSQAVMIGGVEVLVEQAGMDFDGTYLFVLERDDEDWKIVADMFHQYLE